MFFITHNLPVFAIAAVLSSFAWVWGGTRGDLLMSFVPWLSIILIEAAFAFPQRLPYESMADARLRVWRAVRKDKLTWVSVGFLVLLTVPFVNTWTRMLPWCVDRMAHLNVYLWFFPSLLAMVAAKHSLRRHGKRMLAETLVWNGFALAAFGFLQVFTGAEAPFWNELPKGVRHLEFFASFGYANMAGDYFSSLAFIAIGIWRWKLVEVENIDTHRDNAYKVFWMKHYPLIAAAVLYFAALNTLSRSAILLSTAGVVFLFVQAGMMRMKLLDRAQKVRFSAVLFFSVVAISLFALMFTPDSVRREVGTLSAEGVLDRVTGKAEYHTRVASELLSDYPAFGCGGWGYMFLSPSKLPEKITSMFKYDWCRGMANVHNDYMQFLCEHGVLGFGLLLAVVVLAVLPAAKRWKKLAVMARFSKHTGLPWPKGFFCFPPPGIAIYTAAAATMIHALGDCPFRSPAVLSLFFVELVLVNGYLPRGPED